MFGPKRCIDIKKWKALSILLTFQPPIVILNVLVVEAEGLEAKDANGFREGGDRRPFSFEVVKEFFINIMRKKKWIFLSVGK